MTLCSFLLVAVSMPQAGPIGFNMPQPGAEQGSAPYPPVGGGGYGAPYPPAGQAPGYPPPAQNPGYPPPAQNPSYQPPQQGYGGYPPTGPPGGYAPPAAAYPPIGQVVSHQPAASGGKGWMRYLNCVFWVVVTVKVVLVIGYFIYRERARD